MIKVTTKQATLNFWRRHMVQGVSGLLFPFTKIQTGLDRYYAVGVSSEEEAAVYQGNKSLDRFDRDKALGLSSTATYARYHRLVKDLVLIPRSLDRKSDSYWMFRLNVDPRFVADTHRKIYHRLRGLDIPNRVWGGEPKGLRLGRDQHRELVLEVAEQIYRETHEEMLRKVRFVLKCK